MTKHTPGPWEALRAHGRKDLFYVSAKEGNLMIADVENPYADEARAAQYPLEANARLIAEAPAMLEALREIEAAIERKWGQESDRRRANALSPRIEEALADIRALLARIGGES